MTDDFNGPPHLVLPTDPGPTGDWPAGEEITRTADRLLQAMEGLLPVNPYQAATQTGLAMAARRAIALNNAVATGATVTFTDQAAAAPLVPPPPRLRDRINEARQNRLIPPEWVLDHQIPITYKHGGLVLLFNIPVTIREVIHDGRKYTVPPFKIKTTWFLLGLPVDHTGKFVASALFVANPQQGLLPHVDVGSACLGLADGPAAVTGFRDYNQLREVITRAMSQINLASLYTTKASWPKEIRKALPYGTRSDRIRSSSRFNVAIKKYFTETEEAMFYSQ